MIDVAVLAGGCSPEHEVSLRSARRVLNHLTRSRYRPWPVLLDREGAWWPAPRPLSAHEEPDEHFRVAGMVPMRPGAALDRLLDDGLDVVLPVLHGPFGEDGTVQGMLELHGVAFVGSGCAASAVAMDKVRTRECFAAAGIPVGHGLVAPMPATVAEAEDLARRIAGAVGLPCFLKVDVSGSSLGVARVQSRRDITTFLREHRHRGRRLLAEQLLDGEEITVGVLGNCGADLQALPAIGIYPVTEGFFTYAAKYQPGGTDEVIPPRGLDQQQLDAAGDLALRCHRALMCDGMSRTDMILTSSGFRVLETNTIPGMTDQSLLPQAALAAGISYPALLDRLIDLAVAAHSRRHAPTAGVAARG